MLCPPNECIAPKTMKTPSKLLLASAACFALVSVKPASADTVTTTTVVQPQELPEGSNVVT